MIELNNLGLVKDQPMRKRYVILVLVGVVVALGAVAAMNSGCSGFPGQSEWELEVWISEEEQLENGTVRLRGEVRTSGHVTGTTIKGVRVVFTDDDTDASESVHVGTLRNYSQRNLTARLAFVPDVVRIETTDIRTSDDTKYWIKGLKRDESGQYEQYVQTERTCY